MMEAGGGWLAQLAEWASRQLLGLYPRSFRARFGRDVEAGLSRRRGAGGHVSGHDLLDTVVTLARAWSDEVLGRVRGSSWWGAGGRFGEDVRQAARVAVRDPVHAGLVVATLAIALGANAAVFSVTRSVLVRRLPYEDPARVVRVDPAPIRFTAEGGFGVSRTLSDVPWVARAAAYTPDGAANLDAGGPAVQVRVAQVEPGFFRVLGAPIEHGPGLSTSVAAGHEVVLSERLWVRAFGADPGVVGRVVRLSGEPVRIVGVAGAEVSFPSGTDAWVTYPAIPAFYGDAFGAEVLARLTSADAMAVARSEHEARVRAGLAERGDSLMAARRPALIPLREQLTAPVREALLLLLGASSLVLLLGCVNLAGFSLARGSARRAEIAVRRALGAGDARLRAMIVCESLVLALFASLPAVAVAFWGRALLVRILPPELPGLNGAGIGWPTLGLVAVTTVLAGVLIGVAPALRMVAKDVSSAAGRLASGRHRLHPALVVTEIALAVVLVIGAGLFARSLARLHAVPLGYDLQGVLTFEVRLPPATYADVESWRGYAETVRAGLEDRAGVAAVGYSTRLPLAEGVGAGFRVWRADADESTSVPAGVARTSDSFFGALGMPRLAGAGFLAGDRDAVILSRSLAIRLFGREDIAGRHLRMRFSARREPDLVTVAGVVGDVRLDGFEGDVRDILYLPFAERPASWIGFAVRTAGDPAAFSAEVRATLAAIDPSIAPFRVLTTRAAASRSIATRRALTIVTLVFGAAALFLAILGTWGLIAQSVARRRRELGIRMAVGAQTRDVLVMILGETGRLALLGIVLGVSTALALTRFLASLLWGVTATDPPTFAVVIAVVLGAALSAGALPARRAARIDPIETLRTD